MDFEQRTTIRRILEPGARGGHPTAAVTIEWERLWIEGNFFMDTWHARLGSPTLSVTFGKVSKRPTGQWAESIFPRGRDGMPNFDATYGSRYRAIQQLERWTCFNWRRILVQPMGHSWGTAKERPPRERLPVRPGWDASIDELGRWIARNG